MGIDIHMDENVKVTIEGEGLSLTKNTTLQKAGQIISFLGHDGVEQSSAGGTAVTPSLLPMRRVQAREVIVNSGAKTYAQKITVLAVYLRDQQGQDTFTPQELKVLFKKMGDEPKNFTRDLTTAVDLQYVHCVDASSEQYELTDRGSTAVEEGFVGVAVKKSGGKKSTASKGTRNEVADMEISADMDGYPGYHDLPTKGDKILWLLECARHKDVKALTPAEVESLSLKLQDRIESSGFTALNARNIKKSFVIKAKEGLQIQKKGSDYLKKVINTEK